MDFSSRMAALAAIDGQRRTQVILAQNARDQAEIYTEAPRTHRNLTPVNMKGAIGHLMADISEEAENGIPGTRESERGKKRRRQDQSEPHECNETGRRPDTPSLAPDGPEQVLR